MKGWAWAGGPPFQPFFVSRFETAGAPSLRFLQEPALSLPKGRVRCCRYHSLVMPAGLHRTFGAHHLHFITCSCWRRLPFFCTARARDRFLSILEQTRQRYRFVVVGYVVMPEHVHLLVTEPEVGTPSTVMQVVKQRTARALLPKQKRVEKLRYMHRNPVKRGLVSSPEQWRWSSYRFYFSDEAGPVRVNQGWTEIRFGLLRERAEVVGGVKVKSL